MEKKVYTDAEVRETVERGQRLIAQVQDSLRKGNEFLKQFNLSAEVVNGYLADPQTPQQIKDIAEKAKGDAMKLVNKIQEETRAQFSGDDAKKKRGTKKGRKYI